MSLAWINQDLYWPKKAPQKPQKQSQTTRAAKKRSVDFMSDSSESSKTTRTINNAILDASTGTLKMRLDSSFRRLPVKPKAKKPRYQLHRWAITRTTKDNEKTAGVMTCSDCRVNLCLSCYAPFHSESNLEGKRCTIASS